ncbi:serine protease [Streptomyces glaucosporus]|uniref:serine protease n=1 Tax=Streptomyces glaucosporus TaxID=284044 RepID=UPI0031DD6840
MVADVLGLPRDTPDAPGGAVLVDFPLLRDADGTIPSVPARVVSWRPVRPDGGDVALLRLARPVPSARPVPLVDGTRVWGHEFRAYGFPDGAEYGVWASGVLRAVQGAGWLQMDARPGGVRISAGFSGAAAWDDEQGGVVGMTVAAGRGRLDGTAYLVPSAALMDEEVLRPTCPFRGLEPFGEEDAEFFHGRAADTERLYEAVVRRPVTVVAGPSGCGKSSLVRAGLLPRLRADGTAVSVLRPVAGVRPAAVLAQVLVPVLEPDAGEVERLSKVARLAGLLRGDGADGIFAGLRAALRERCGEGGLLVFVDQLEEYAAADPEAARELFSLLIALAGEPGGPRVVATARAETLDALVTSETSGVLSDAVLLLAPLAADDLLDAVTGPVDAVPGLWLEPRLAERIVVDAADEPGRMPLVEFALTRLWERRTGAMLTHAAYEELGGVAGALVGYAEDTVSDHVPPGEESVTRRLFVQLARPDDRGGFGRRATPLTDLDPAAARLARRLAAGKLLVLSRTAEGTEVVDLAHEALTRLWPRLRGWLEDSREFRAWQEQLRGDLARWEAGGREPEGLLRGRLLTAAADWLDRRPEDVTAAERAYIEAGWRHQRRGVRRRQAAVAGLTVLALVATVLAAVAVRSQRETERNLRTLASSTLAERADRLSARDPGTAMQLALAAWHTERTPRAEAALLGQYVRGQYLRGSHEGLWRGQPVRLTATPDARTLVVVSEPGGGDPPEATVITGAPEGEPRRRHVLRGVPGGDELRTAVSPDGRYYAVATPDGAVYLWRLDRRDRRPTVLARGGEVGHKVAWVVLDFSEDGRRLLRLATFLEPRPEDEGRGGLLEAWDTADGEPLPVGRDVIPRDFLPSEAAFGRDPDTVVTVRSQKGNELSSEVTVRELGTGRLVRRIVDRAEGGEFSLGGGGALAYRERSLTYPVTVLGVYDTATGESRKAKGGLWADGGGEYTYKYETQDSARGEYTEVLVTRLATGHTHRTRVPVGGAPGHRALLIAVVPRGDGGPVVLAAVGDALVAARTLPGVVAETEASQSSQEAVALTSDGRRVARVYAPFSVLYRDLRRLEVADLVRGGGQTVDLPRKEGSQLHEWKAAWTARDTRLVVWKRSGTRLYVYDPRDLDDRREVRLDAGGDTRKPAGRIDAVAPLTGGDVAVLTAGGALLRVDPERGAQVGAPLRTGLGTADSDQFYEATGRIAARPGRPYQVAVAPGPDVERREAVELWDLGSRARIGVLASEEAGAVHSRYELGEVMKPVVFSPDGEELLVRYTNGHAYRWRVDARRITGPRITLDDDGLIGMTNGGVVVTQPPEEGSHYELRRAGTGAQIGRISAVIGATEHFRGDRLITESEGWRQEFDLRPGVWFRELCRAVGRDHTAAEQKLLPPGTRSGPPCAGAE